MFYNLNGVVLYTKYIMISKWRNDTNNTDTRAHCTLHQ